MIRCVLDIVLRNDDLAEDTIDSYDDSVAETDLGLPDWPLMSLLEPESVRDIILEPGRDTLVRSLWDTARDIGREDMGLEAGG